MLISEYCLQVFTQETPEVEAFTSLYDTWTQDISATSHFHGARMDAYDR